jgi:predicted O-methyltransferase YrrM
MDAARRIGFATSRAEVDPDTPAPSCSLPEAGRVLAMLAAGCHRIGEIGTGTGAGAAWMASAMPASATLVTVEVDADRAHAATEVFADDPRVRVLHDDAATALPRYAPFDLLFADGRWPDRSSLVDLLRVGGRVVMDDVTPVAALPPDSPFRSSDPKRDFFFANPRLVSAEIVLPDLANSVLVGTRVS